MANTLVRDEFIREMTDEMKKSTGLGLKMGDAWKVCFHQEKTDKRREETGNYVWPSVSYETAEGGAFRRGEVRHGFSSYVVPLTYTLEVKVSGEFIEDNRMREVEQQSFGLGQAFSRRRYKRACEILYRGFDAVQSQDAVSLFSASHSLAINTSPAIPTSNLLTATLTTDAFDSACNILLTQPDENGDVYPTDLSKIRLIVPPQNARTALQIAGSTYEPENMNNAINVYSGAYGKYSVEVVILPLLFEAPSAYRSTQWYVQDANMHGLYFWERLAVDTWHIPDPNSRGTLYQGAERSEFQVQDWRGMVGSKGTG